ncbi:MAG TPA: NADH-quinone oxidoreductase subunit J [Planctomycetota bacterium]|nr:NADH-quinone oxidoreductase subunit J [Planctomycetota bacterium]
MVADIVFAVSALVCIISGICIVSQKNPVYSVVFMLPLFLAMTMIFVLLSATFLAAIQMIVYGGAILVVFLFVIMLINLQPDELRDDFALLPYTLTSVAIGMLGAVIVLFVRTGTSIQMEAAFAAPVPDKAGTVFGSIESIAAPLFRQQMVPFELASVLIVVAILGAVLLSKKRV